MKNTVIALKNVGKTYKKGDNDVVVHDALDMTVNKGEFVAIMGPSGSGKTTLLNILGGIESATSGEVKISGQALTGLTDGEISKWRAQNVGIIFQSYNLMQYLTARENIRLPLLLTHFSGQQQEQRVDIALELVGLKEKAKFYPRELSGGQEQRVAIARAIVSDPQILLCDEPTGDLDRKTADEIMSLLKNLCEQEKKTIVMVTHDSVAAEYAHRVYHMDKESRRLTSDVTSLPRTQKKCEVA